jgi:predicted methyltransferase
MRKICLAMPVLLLTLSGAPGVALAAPSPAILAAVAHEDRPSADRKADARRKPAEILDFAGLGPGMQVADLMAGDGWYTELLSHLVGPEGRVYAQNNTVSYGRYGFRLRVRVQHGIPRRWFTERRLPNVSVLENDLETLEEIPEGELDAALMVNFYHDTYWMGVDRVAMLARILSCLKPGGVFLVIDHEAGERRGASEAKRLHRVEGAQVVREVTEAGFVLDAKSDLLRNPDDALGTSVFEEGTRGYTDRFILRFVKPGS